MLISGTTRDDPGSCRIIGCGPIDAEHDVWVADRVDIGCFRHQLLLPRPYLVLTKPLRLDIQCQRGANVKIGWKYLDD